ncbi:MAG: hypothetical protein ACJ8LM_01385 [Candidatus Udaeobacter sp.]
MDQFTVKTNFSTAVFPALDAYHVPMNPAPVAVIRFLVSLGRSELKRVSDFPIKDVPDRLQDARIKAERKFTL